MKPLFVGADPEIFLVDSISGSLISAVGRIGGSKMQPQALPIGPGFAVQEDNVALEYNIPASQSSEDLVNNITLAMRHLLQMVQQQGLSFSQDSAAFFPEDQLQDPRALEFGCDPDFNAWTHKMNPRPKAADATLRSCGGHVHIGTDTTNLDREALIRRCDLFLGVPSQLMDSGSLRKKLYGKAGAFRPKAYGVEYRTLSNFWIFRPELVSWVYQNTRLALDAEHLPVEEDQQAILDAINKNNSAAARHLIDKYSIPMVF